MPLSHEECTDELREQLDTGDTTRNLEIQLFTDETSDPIHLVMTDVRYDGEANAIMVEVSPA